MAVSPIITTDKYGKGFEQVKKEATFLGRRSFNFGANRTDKDRLEKITRFNRALDHSPHVPEVKAWNMRPRHKELEIQP